MDESFGEPEYPGSAATKRYNKIMLLYDAPLYRDWAAWLTLGMAVLTFWAILDSPPTGELPVWLDALLAAVIFAVLFGALPAFLRLQYRRWRWRKRSRRVAGQPSTAGKTESRGHGGYRVSERTAASNTNSRPSEQGTKPVTVLHAKNMSESSILTSSRQSLPYPIARVSRALQLATEPKTQYETILDTAEAVSVSVGALAVAWMRREGLGQPELGELQEAYKRGVPQGVWHDVIRAFWKCSEQHPSPLPGSVAGLRIRKGSGLLIDLRLLLEERNRWAHGARPHSTGETMERVSILFDPVERVLQNCLFLAAFPWVLTERSSYRRRQNDFEVVAQRAMGDHPEFESVRLSTSRPLADETFYVALPEGPVDLSPLIAARYCAKCRQREMCYADRIDPSHGVALKSFSTGHVLYDDSLTDEVRHLANPDTGVESA